MLSAHPVRPPYRWLALWVVGVCVAVIVYASLQPFSGWIAPPPTMPLFLLNWTQRWTVSDALFNVLAYAPLGLALVIAAPRGWSRKQKIAVAFAAAAALSLAVETAQMWLPTRYASVYDTMANLGGTVLGGLLGLALTSFTSVNDGLTRLRDTLIVAGPTGDLKLVLLCVWLLAQINPAIPLFGATFHPGQVAAFEPVVVIVELVQTAAALIGIGLFTDLAMRKRWMGGVALSLVIALAITMKTAAAQAVLKPLAWDAWLRPGHTLGLAAGAFALMALFWLPRNVKSVLAGIALLTSVLIGLLLPDFVSAKAPLSVFSWSYGHLLHLNGLTHTIVILWPFVATGVLFWRFVVPQSRRKATIAADTKMPP